MIESIDKAANVVIFIKLKEIDRKEKIAQHLLLSSMKCTCCS